MIYIGIDPGKKGALAVIGEDGIKTVPFGEEAYINALIDTVGFENDEYIDIRAVRVPLLDGKEEFEPRDNYWLNEEIRMILVRDYGWRCYEPNEYFPCEECIAKNFCSHYES